MELATSAVAVAVGLGLLLYCFGGNQSPRPFRVRLLEESVPLNSSTVPSKRSDTPVLKLKDLLSF